MLNVSQAIKDKFQSDLCRKELRITIGNTVLTNEAIYKEGFKLTESIMDGTVEFVGCIASMLEFKISTLVLAKGNYKGATVTAEVAVYLTDGTLSSYVPLFHGFVDECTKSADGYYQEFVCYDRLAYLSDEPGYNMYKAAFNGSSVDLETFRDAIVLDCGMDAVNSQTLPNDDIIFRKRKRNKDITAMALLRHIAQINGAFGILNRDNRFEFRQIDDSASPEAVAYYRDLKYSDYVVRPVGDSTTTPPTGSITIRTNSQDAGVTVDWTNYSQYVGTDPGWSDESQDTYLVDDDDANVIVDSYIIEGNLIAYKLKAAKKRVIGANILASLGHDAVFREYSVKCNGLPYVECCDKVLFTKKDQSQIEFIVTKRVLEGVQNMTDTYSCTINSQDSNNKTFVSNVDNSTNSLGGNPDDALGLTEKTITENGTYSALDDGAEGYSQVTVDVEGEGIRPSHIDVIFGYTVEDLTKGDCVYVEKGGEEVQADVVHSVLDNYNIRYLGYSSALRTVYFLEYQGTSVYEIGLDDIYSGQPRVFKTVDYSTFYMSRNIMSWYDGTHYHFYNLDTLEEYIDDVNTTSTGNQNFFTVMTSKYSQRNQIGAMLIDDFSLVYPFGNPSHYSFQTYARMFDDGNYAAVASFSNSGVNISIVHEGQQSTQFYISRRMLTGGNTYTVFKDFFICGERNSDPDIGGSGIEFMELANGHYNRLEHKNGGVFLIGVDGTFRVQFNAEGDLLGIKCDDGLIVLNDIDVLTAHADCSLYTNIDAGTSYGFEMFDDFTYVIQPDTSSARVPGGILYATPRAGNYVVGKTNNKQHAGELGWVDVGWPSGSLAKVYVLYE